MNINFRDWSLKTRVTLFTLLVFLVSIWSLTLLLAKVQRDDMVKLLGGRAIYNSSPILQPWLDLHAGRAHVANDPANRTGDVVGALGGQAPGFTFL